jgi:hypothetical protein
MLFGIYQESGNLSKLCWPAPACKRRQRGRNLSTTYPQKLLSVLNILRMPDRTSSAWLMFVSILKIASQPFEAIEVYEGPTLAWQHVQAIVQTSTKPVQAPSRAMAIPAVPPAVNSPAAKLSKALLIEVVTTLSPLMNDAQERKALVKAALFSSPVLQ